MDPVRVATQIRLENGFGFDLPIDIKALLQPLNIKLIYDNLGSEYLGCCAIKGLKKIIIINECLKSQYERERFTIGHEIGHLVLHHGKSVCSKYDFNEIKLTHQKENDANEFSSELLLPQKAMMEYLSKRDISFKLILYISKKYECSLTSTAIKLVKLSKDPIALFLHENDKINWSITSSNCKYIPLTGKIGFSSKVINCNDSGKIKEGYVDNEKWFIDITENEKCYEETIYFSKLKKSLTIVKIEESYDY
jgi:Zn-dependent peptidase ImmA (M78 family)